MRKPIIVPSILLYTLWDTPAALPRLPRGRTRFLGVEEPRDAELTMVDGWWGLPWCIHKVKQNGWLVVAKHDD